MICVALAVGLLVPVLVVAANLWVFSSARPYMYGHRRQVPSRAVAIVPGTKVFGDLPSVGLRQRLMTALTLYKEGKVNAILVSGNRRDAAYNEALVMSRWLIAQGVPRAHVFEDPAGYRTLDTMQRAAQTFGVTEAIVCSQSVHLARAVFLARRAGIDAVGLATDSGRSLHAMPVPHETMGSALAAVETLVGRNARVVGTPPQPIDGDLRTTAALR